MKMRVKHCLNRIKGCETPKHVICVDTETTAGKENEDGEKQLTLKLGYACHIRTRTEGSEHWCKFTTIDEFWKWLDEEACEQDGHYFLFAHNWHFDFNILDGFRSLVKHGYRVGRFVIESHPFIVDAYHDEKQVHLTFIDTTNYVLKPLKSIGADLGLPKLSIDFGRADDEALAVYCRRDVEILVLFIRRLLDFIVGNDLGNFQPTIAGLSFSAFRHRFMKHDIVIHDADEVLDLEGDSYRGGRNEARFIGRLKGTVCQLDINSQYPFMMSTQKYPIKLVRRWLWGVTAQQLHDLMQKYLVIARCLINISQPAIGVKRKINGQPKLVFPVGTFEAVLTTPELEWVLEHGKVLEVSDLALYDGANIFEDYVKFFYEKRQEYRKAGNDTYQLMAKIYLNSLYGKFGQKHSLMVPLGASTSQLPAVEDVYDANAGTWTHYVELGGTRWEQSPDKYYSFDSFPAIASFVTAYARMYLWKLIETAGEGEVFYMDTDSLFTNELGYKRLEKAGFIDDKALGKLKLERTIGVLDIRGCKDYTRDGKDVRKGVKFDAVRQADGGYRQPQFMKTKTLLRSGISGAVVIRQVVKHRRTKYDKGTVTGSGAVVPLKVEEAPARRPERKPVATMGKWRYYDDDTHARIP